MYPLSARQNGVTVVHLSLQIRLNRCYDDFPTNIFSSPFLGNLELHEYVFVCFLCRFVIHLCVSAESRFLLFVAFYTVIFIFILLGKYGSE